VSQESQITN